MTFISPSRLKKINEISSLNEGRPFQAFMPNKTPSRCKLLEKVRPSTLLQKLISDENFIGNRAGVFSVTLPSRKFDSHRKFWTRTCSSIMNTCSFLPLYTSYGAFFSVQRACQIPIVLHLYLERYSLFCVLTSILSHLMTSSVPNLHNTKILNISGTRWDMTKRKTPFFFPFKGLSNSPIFEYLNFSFHRQFNLYWISDRSVCLFVCLFVENLFHRVVFNRQLRNNSCSWRLTCCVNREFKIYDATVAKSSLKIASSTFSIYFSIMPVCLSFES